MDILKSAFAAVFWLAFFLLGMPFIIMKLLPWLTTLVDWYGRYLDSL
jgi:hypothetical protein